MILLHLVQGDLQNFECIIRTLVINILSPDIHLSNAQNFSSYFTENKHDNPLVLLRGIKSVDCNNHVT